MPWQELRPMDQRVLFVADYLRESYSFTDLCDRFGVSRKTGYKWVERYRQEGVVGLYERSRRPRHSPLQTPYAIRQAIVELRTKTRITPGAKKIHKLLSKRFPTTPTPSLTTIYSILHQEGLVKQHKRRRRVSPYPHSLKSAYDSNELWSVDFKGQLKLGDGHWCYPLTIMDHHSRYLCCCHGLDSTRTAGTQKAFIRTFREYGMPARIRSDNGVPFATSATGGLSRLSVWWIKLGIIPERIKPGKPQQNGRHERMHRTLKQATAKPPARSMRAQQRRFAEFCKEYNDERPHESLGQEPPGTVYTPSSRAYPDKLAELEYPDYMEVRKVSNNGTVYWGNGQVYVSYLLHNEPVGMEQVGDGEWDIYFGPIRLGSFNERNKKGHSVNYWSVKV